MGIPTLISTSTASGASSIDITSGIDSTYDEYMFVFTDIHPSADAHEFQFQVNASGGSGYNETITSTAFRAYHNEDDSATSLSYSTSSDQAQGTSYQTLMLDLDNDADSAGAGELHLFNPSSTTYVKHFYAETQYSYDAGISYNNFVAGYINTTTAIDEVQFKMSSGNFDGVIQLYGIA